MNDQAPNDQFSATSFMEGENAEYLEHMYARYADDPNAVDEAWQAFFKAMGDDEGVAQAEAAGPSWARTDWPPTPNGEVMGALTGEWPAPIETKAAGDKIKAKAGIDLFNLIAKQAVQMGRVAGAGRRCNIHMADIAIGAVNGQMQPAAPHARVLQCRT